MGLPGLVILSLFLFPFLYSNSEPLNKVPAGLLQQSVARHEIFAPGELPGVRKDHPVVRLVRRQEVEARGEHRPGGNGTGLATAVGVVCRDRLQRRHARARIVIGRAPRRAKGLERLDVRSTRRTGPCRDRGGAQVDRGVAVRGVRSVPRGVDVALSHCLELSEDVGGVVAVVIF